MAYQAIPPAGSGDPWITTQKSLLLRECPTLTAFVELKPGRNEPTPAVATAATNDAQKVGGGIAGTGAYKAASVSIYQTPKTTVWGLCFRGSLPTPVAGKFNQFGLANAGSLHDIGVASYNTVDAANYVLNIDGAGATTVASTTAITAAVADYAVTFNGTTIKIWRNGALLTSTATLTNVSDEPMFPVIWSTDTNAAYWLRGYYGYIAP